MKILVIRCRNIASLGDEITIDFQQEPLASAGLFAISGPTGSGKTTILDALCLALFEQVPRLYTVGEGSSGVQIRDVSNGVLSLKDPRNLLRKGTSEGYAEVDFVGIDGSIYRARWSIRRARSKVDGTLQKTTMNLQKLPNLEPIGHKKEEVLAEIEKRLGLNFKQFCRAVLLAQNEFNAFLKASSDERAELLEMLTGLSSFTWISQQAYNRSDEEQKKLLLLQEKINDYRPLSPEERILLEDNYKTAEDAKKQQLLVRDRLNKALEWHKEFERLNKSVQESCVNYENSLIESNKASPRKKQLGLIECIQEIRPLIAVIDQRDREAKILQDELLALERSKEKHSKALTSAQSAFSLQEQLLKNAEKDKQDAKGLLDIAKGLDAEIRLLDIQWANRQKELDDLKNQAQKSLSGLSSNKKKLAKNQKTEEDIKSWLIANSKLQSLADNKDRINERLKEANAFLSKVTESSSNIIQKKQAFEDARLNQHTAGSQFITAQKNLAEAEEGLKKAQKTYTDLNPESISNKRTHLTSRLKPLSEAEREWKNLLEKHERHASLQKDLEDLIQEMAIAEQTKQMASEQLKSKQPRLEQAVTSLQIFETTCSKSLEDIRHSLEEGCPCPLCGATQHPYSNAELKLQHTKNAFALQVDLLHREIAGLEKEESTCTGKIALGQSQIKSKEKQISALIQERDAGRRHWNSHPMSAEIESIEEQNRLIWFKQQLNHLEDQMKLVEKADLEISHALKTRDNASEILQKLRQKFEKARENDDKAQKLTAQKASELHAEEKKREDYQVRLEETLQLLIPLFNDDHWMEAWKHNPEQFLRTKNEEAKSWFDQSELLKSIQKDVQTIQIDIKHLDKERVKEEKAIQESQSKVTLLEHELREKQNRRHSIFEGKATSEVEAKLEDSSTKAKEEIHKQRQNVSNFKEAHDRTCQLLEQKSLNLAQSSKSASEEREKLENWLNTCPKRTEGNVFLDIHSLKTLLLDHNQEWIKQEREALSSIEDDCKKCRTIHEERQKCKLEHESKKIPSECEESGESLAILLKNTLTGLDTIDNDSTNLKLKRLEDDRKLQQTEKLRIEFLNQEQLVNLWDKLSHLIGSKDGKKFRNFAQQYTLDVLLGYANHHLNSLAPRYHLEKIEDTLALQVVDQEMGNEIRSVHSLSGGESFLVSLALALGLASLSSNRIKVESLFIDEGFGSLDADTLNTAMNALDSLQSIGRKVGVISHVKEMTDRIGVQIRVNKQHRTHSTVEVISI
jgi:DNA repair protein SbcC/Rad50